jgi:hypothetical protein
VPPSARDAAGDDAARDAAGDDTQNAARDGAGDAAQDDAGLRSGQAVIHLSYWAPDNSGEPVELRHVAEGPHLYFDEQQLMCPPGWGLKVPVADPALAEEFAVFFWFADTNTDADAMSAGTGEMSFIAVDIPTSEHGGQSDGPFEKSMIISQSTGSVSSGEYDGDASIEVAFYAPDAAATGEKIVVHSVAFRDVETDVPDDTSPVGVCDEPAEPDECAAVYEGNCFGSLAEACEAAGCAESECNVAETLPPQVACN